VLKKTSASVGLVISSALFAPLTSSPAYAHANQLRGWHGHHHRSSHHSHHRNRNWNGNRHRARIFIRIYVYNKNNNRAIALARPERRDDRPAVIRRDDRPIVARRDVDSLPSFTAPDLGTGGVTGDGATGTSPTA
jgi:hypothetical protein